MLKGIVVLLSLIPSLSFAKEKPQKDLADAGIHFLNNMNGFETTVLYVCVPVGVMLIAWGILMIMWRTKNHQITWKMISLRIIAGSLLISLYPILASFSMTAFGEEGQQVETFINQKKEKGGEVSRANAENVKKCIDGGDCLEY